MSRARAPDGDGEDAHGTDAHGGDRDGGDGGDRDGGDGAAAGSALPRAGTVRVGPHPLRRILPLWLVGGSVVALVFSGFAADTWRSVGVDLPALAGYAVGWATLMVVLFVLVGIVFGREASLRVDLDARRMRWRRPGTLLGRGQREDRSLDALRSVQEHPDGSAVLEIRADHEEEAVLWEIEHVGWNHRSWDGMRALQRARGLPVSPPLDAARQQAHRALEIVHQREAARAVGLEWIPDYEEDPAVFQRDYDARRRELAGRDRAPAGHRRPQRRPRR